MIYLYLGFENKCDSKLETLFHNNLWFSSHKKFNDPFDCDYPFLIDVSLEDYRRFAEMCSTKKTDPSPIIREYEEASLEERKLILNGVRKLFLEKIASWGVCCFSKIWDSILMWSHYADKHSGICIGYDESTSDRELNEVRYASHYPASNKVEGADLQSFLKEYMLTKSAHWIYEQEHRLINYTGCDKSEPSPYPIVDITFGVDINRKRKEHIMDHLHNSVVFYDAIHEITGKYGLSRTPAN